MATEIYIDPHYLTLTFEQFEQFHKECLSHDTLTARQRWLKIGGYLPDKVKVK